MLQSVVDSQDRAAQSFIEERQCSCLISQKPPSRIRLQLTLHVGHGIGCCSKSIQSLLQPIFEGAHRILQGSLCTSAHIKKLLPP